MTTYAVIVDDADPSIHYSGTWSTSEGNPAIDYMQYVLLQFFWNYDMYACCRTSHVTTTNGSSFTYTFVGASA